MTVRRSRQLSFVTAWELPAWSTGPVDAGAMFDVAAAAGYEGMQVPLPGFAERARAAGFAHVSGLGPARTPDQVAAAVGDWAAAGVDALVLHVGTGFETEAEATALLEAVQRAQAEHPVEILVETHRATLTQDPARTLRLVEAAPDLRFCGDLSHWYTGVELVYGDLDDKLARLAPVFERVRMLHGRISDPGCIQVAVEPADASEHVEHFRRMWRAVLAGCEAAGVDELPFVVELLPASVHYARTVDRGDGPTEEVDRWAQADVLWSIFEALETGA